MADVNRKTLDSEASSTPYWRAPWEFAVHSIVGTVIFGLIAGAAVILDLVGHALAANGVSIIVTYAVKVAEYAIFVTDLFLFAVFLFRTAIRAIRKL